MRTIKISPSTRAQQTLMRQGVLSLSLPYEGKLLRRRTKVVASQVKALVALPPSSWLSHIEISEPYLYPMMREMYLNIGKVSSHTTVNRFLSRKSDDMWLTALDEWMNNNLGKRIKSMSTTLVDWFTSTLSQVMEANQGLGIEALTQIMTSTMLQRWGEVKEWQVRRVIQTETMTSLGVAADEAVRATGLDYIKTWCIAGLNTRPSHEAMDGVTINGEECFQVGDGALLSYPMDSSYGAPPEEIINCSCTCIYLPREETITDV
jgi:hypothetical protein